MASRRHRSASVPLLLAWLGLIVYTSLYPFNGWRWPPGAALTDLLVLPWPRYFIGFDIVANLLGYMPLGFLLCVLGWRRGHAAVNGLLLAVLCGATLSYAMECTQYLLPQRVSSLLDALLNTVGTAMGGLLATFSAARGWLDRWQSERDRWFAQGSAMATTLLLLWPAGLLFPAPLPLGLGQIGAPVRQLLARLLADIDWAGPSEPTGQLGQLVDWLGSPSPLSPPLPNLVEALATALGLLCPCLLACCAARPGYLRSRLILAVATLAFAVTTLSTALNFGPDRALAWVTPSTLLAMAAALGLAMALRNLPPRRTAVLALLALLGMVLLVHAAPADPYYAQSLHDWAQGRFVRFHGLAQWVGWLWPYAAMAWLLSRLGASSGPRS